MHTLRRCHAFLLMMLMIATLIVSTHAFLPNVLSSAFIPYHRWLAPTSPLIRSFRYDNSLVQLSLDNTNHQTSGDSASKQKQQQHSSQTEATTKQEKRLSRPERKSLEREKRKNQPKIRKQSLLSTKNKKTIGSKYKLHSQAISQLTQKSTPSDVLRAIKRAQNSHDHHDLHVIQDFLFNECDESFAYGYMGSLLARLAVAALHFNNHDVARNAITIRRQNHSDSMKPMESAAIIRGLLRVHNVTDAFALLHDELALPKPGSNLTEHKNILKFHALSLASIASRHFFEGEPYMAVQACAMLAEVGPLIRESTLQSEDLTMPWLRILSGAAQCESRRRDGSLPSITTTTTTDTTTDDAVVAMEKLPCNLVYSVLNAMTTFPSENGDSVYEALSNALVRRVLFVTGAVEMSGCPPADRGEAVFIGRSNVGKSSLINMITNRKSLAYTSKRPGKTKEFNFFAVNDKPGREKEIRFGDVVAGSKDRDSFYIVDLPGFGYAKVPEQQRKQWANFMSEYLATRKTLRVVFHLVDGRHGPIDEDMTIMKRVGENLPKHVAYVVVLTKADKNVKSVSKTNPGKVSRDVIQDLRDTMKTNKVGNAPIIVTSSETKLGRDDIWRFLRLAAEASK